MSKKHHGNHQERERQVIGANDAGTLDVTQQSEAAPVVITQEKIASLLQTLQSLAEPAKASDDNPKVAAVKASDAYKAARPAEKAWMTMRARHTPEELAEIHKQAAAKATASRKKRAAETQKTLADLQAIVQAIDIEQAA